MTLTAMLVLSLAVFSSPAGAAVPGQVVITEWMYNPRRQRVRVRRGDEHRWRSGRHERRTRSTTTAALAGTFPLAEPRHAGPRRVGPDRRDHGGGVPRRVGSRHRASRSPRATPRTSAAATRSTSSTHTDGTRLADRLTYGDQVFTAGARSAPRARPASRPAAWRVGANNVGLWEFSAVGDGLGTVKSVTASATPGRRARSPLERVRAGHDRRRQRHAATRTRCRASPEAASGTGPAPAGAQPWPGESTVTVADQLCAWKTTTGPEGRDMSGLVFDPTDAERALGGQEQELGVPPREAGRPVGGRHRQRLGRRQADPLPRRDRPARLRGPHGRPRRRALRHDRARQRQQLGRRSNSVLRFDPNAAGTTLTADHAVEPHGRLPRAASPAGQGQPRLRGRHLRARPLPGAEGLRRPVDRRRRTTRPTTRTTARACTSRRWRTTGSCTPTP